MIGTRCARYSADPCRSLFNPLESTRVPFAASAVNAGGQVADSSPARRIRREAMDRSQVREIAFQLSDGRGTGILGNAGDRASVHQVASYPAHRLSAIRYQGQPGRIDALCFGFSPLPDYYDVVAARA